MYKRQGEVTEARNSFTRYFQTFPEGAFSLNANYYIGLIDYNQKAYESAARHLDKVCLLYTSIQIYFSYLLKI